MENLRWARILVKTKGGELPSLLKIGVEEISYNLPLWWEVLSLIRQNSEGYQGLTDRSRGEVKGDEGAHADPRVEERGNARLKTLSRTADETEGQVDRRGRVLTVGWIQFESTIRSSMSGAEVGSSLIGLAKTLWAQSGLGGLFCKPIQKE